MNPRGLSIGQLLPHVGPMLLLDELLELRDDGLTASLVIRADSLFCAEQQGVPAWVGMEYMAQAACAFSGLEEARAGVPISISLLLGTRAYRCREPLFPLGTRLLVDARMLLRDDEDLAVFDCAIRDAADGRELAAGDIKAIRPRDLPGLLRRQHAAH